MIDQQHPITPPPELVKRWYNECPEANEASLPFVATQAARWGFDQRTVWDAEWLEAQLQRARDQELEACCEWLDYNYPSVNCAALRAARRPKPPSLKQQALERLSNLESDEPGYDLGIIRRALEQLDD